MLDETQIEKARSIDLLSYLQAYEPGNLKRLSANSYCLRDHDSLKISGNGKWFWFSRGFGSNNALDYLVKVRGISFVDAVESLVGNQMPLYTANVQPRSNSPPKSAEFKLPPRNKDYLRVMAYLQSRGIDRDIIMQAINNGSIYESAAYHNCVFVGKDAEGKARFATQRGIMGNFKNDVAGSDKRFGFNIASVDSPEVFVFESAIDALSMATIFNDAQATAHPYLLSLGCTSPLALEQFLKDHPSVSSITLCLDNDPPGREAAYKIGRQLADQGKSIKVMLPAEGKDWNAVLMASQQSKGTHHRSRHESARFT